jgi:hypothetical protein
MSNEDLTLILSLAFNAVFSFPVCLMLKAIIVTAFFSGSDFHQDRPGSLSDGAYESAVP